MIQPLKQTPPAHTPTRPHAHTPTELSARIVQWDRKKGYGFLQSGEERVFLHSRNFVELIKKPELGDEIRFTLGEDDKGRSYARNAVHARLMAGISVRSIFIWIGLMFLPLVSILTFHAQAGLTLLYLLLLNCLTVLVYRMDKRSFGTGDGRISEAKLHSLEMLGGWPGAFLAQRCFNHKRSKASYQAVFLAIIFCHQYLAFDFILDWDLSEGLADLQRFILRSVLNFLKSLGK